MKNRGSTQNLKEIRAAVQEKKSKKQKNFTPTTTTTTTTTDTLSVTKNKLGRGPPKEHLHTKFETNQCF